MKNKFKKILTTSLVSAMTLTTLCAAGSEKISTKTTHQAQATMIQNNTQENENKDTVAKGSSRHKVGKIIETSLFANNDLNTYTRSNGSNYLTNKPSVIEENLSTSSNNQMSLFVLSEFPYITLSTDDNNSRFNMFVNFSRNQYLPHNSITQNETTSNSLQSSSNAMGLKRAILSIYTNELYNGNINLSDSTKAELENQLNTLSENNSTNQTSENNLSSINSVIEILENNLSPSSSYYGKRLNNFSLNTNTQSSAGSQYKDIADKIVNTFGLHSENTNQSESSTSQTITDQPKQNTTSNQIIQNEQNQHSLNTTRNITRQNEIQNNTNQTQNRNTQNQTSLNQQNTMTNNIENNSLQNQSNNLNNPNRRYFSNNNSYDTNTSNNQNNTNQNRSRSTRTMRADRTQNIDYISGNPKFNNSNRPRASRTPYHETQQIR